jgi:peptide/nickel transport system substrate-binding protein
MNKLVKPLMALSLALTITTALAAAPADTFVYYTFGEYESLDPAKSYDTAGGTRIENAYETLIAFKGRSTTELEGLLASSWKVSSDGKQLTFVLRKGVKFHSGNTMSCFDAEYSFRRLIINNDPGTFAPYLATPLLGTGADANTDKTITWARITKAVQCDNNGNLVLTLAQKDPAILAKITYTAGSVLDSKLAIASGDWSGSEKDWKELVGKDLTQSAVAKKVSGTGAYRILSAEPAGRTLMQAFDDYWGSKPKIKNVLIQVVTDESQRITALNKGDADRVDLGQRASLARVEAGGSGKVIDDIPAANGAPMIFMQQNIKDKDQLGSGKLDGKGIPANFFSDVNVRLGFASAFNYDRALSEILLGKGEQRAMGLPKGYIGYNSSMKPIGYNLEVARGYLQKAFDGQLWKNGFTISGYYNNGNTTRQRYLELLKAGLEGLNPKFKMEVKSLPFGELISKSDAGNIPMMAGGWNADYPDSDNFIRAIYWSEGTFSGRTSFKDARIDKLIDQAYDTYDIKRRGLFYQQLGTLARDLAPVILLPAGTGFRTVSKDLKGYSENFNPLISADVFFKDLSK